MTIIYESLFAALFWLGCLLFLAGLALLLLPRQVLAFSDALNQWISTEPFFSKLDQQYRFERQFYRYHIVMGSIIIAGAVGSLYFLAGNWLGGQLTLASLFEHVLTSDLSAVLLGMLIAGNGIALLIGCVVLIRPSLLKGVETWANTWVESRQLAAGLDTNIEASEKWLPRYPRLVGLLTLIGSLYILSSTAVFVVN